MLLDSRGHLLIVRMLLRELLPYPRDGIGNAGSQEGAKRVPKRLDFLPQTPDVSILGLPVRLGRDVGGFLALSYVLDLFAEKANLRGVS